MKTSFKNIREIASNARTSVWSLQDATSDTVYAFKHLNSSQPSPYEMARLRYEYSILETLDTPLVPKVHGFMAVNGQDGILLSSFGDCNLEQMINARQRLDIGLSLRIALQLVDALAAIHKADIIHKDLCPANILIEKDSGRIQLIDFSLAQKKQSATQSAERKLEGTLPYVSPEQTGRMNRELDYRSDFYSLGITLFHMLTGRLPFEARDMLGFIHAHIARKPPRPSSFHSDLPPILDALILRLLEKNAEDRYQSAFGLHYDLKQCLDAWDKQQRIDSFTLGINDRYEALNFSSNLFGRDEEREQLLRTYARVEEGAFACILLGGASGVGKTALVHEVERPITVRRGFFVSGKFDQYQRQTPLAAVVQALEKLMQQTLLRPDDEIRDIKNHLKEKLGRVAPFLLRILPAAEALIDGPVEAEAETPSASEASRQTLRSLLVLLEAFAAAQKPIVIFLDDLQWSDQASLELIRELFQAGKAGSLMLVLAYRDNEVSSSHPFGVLLDEIMSKSQSESLHLKALTLQHTEDFISHTLQKPRSSLLELSQSIFAQSEGNPFYIIEILRDLHSKDFFHFDHTSRSWSFDLQQLKNQSSADSVVGFLIDRLGRFPRESLQLLQVGACIGHSFELKSLKSEDHRSEREILTSLLPALHNQLITCRSHEVNVLLQLSSEFPETVTFQFRHDRIQQAVYSMLDDASKERLHLRLARQLVKEDGVHALKTAQHYAKAWPLVTDPQELRQMLEILSDAARQAKQANAYETALHYVGIARQLMPPEFWQDAYELAFAIDFNYFEANFLLARFEESEASALQLLSRVTDLERQLRVYYFLCFQYAIQMNHEECIRIGLKGLSLCGIKIPRHPNFLSILFGYRKVRSMLQNLSDEQLIKAPEIIDPISKLSQKILFEVIAASVNSDQRWLVAACIFCATRFGIKQGNSPETAYAYLLFSITQFIYFKERTAGKRLAQIAMTITESLSSPYLRGRIYGCYGNFIHRWYYSSHDQIHYLKKSMEASYDEGDLLWIAAVSITIPLFTKRLNLEEMGNLQHRYNEIISGTGHHEFMAYGKGTEGYTLALRGLTSGPLDFSFPGFDETERVAFLRNIRGYLTLANMYLLKIENALTHGDERAASRLYRDNKRVFRAMIGTGNMIELMLFEALIRARKAAKGGLFGRILAAASILPTLFEAKAWQVFNPENFNYYVAFLNAELFRLFGLSQRASKAYEEAIEASRASESSRELALALQTAFEYHHGRSVPKLARVYWDDCLQMLQHWGAQTRLDYLKKRYGHAYASPVVHVASSHEEASSGSHQSLDILTLIKTSHALIGEVRLESLLKRLMDVLLENVGATTVALILPHQSGSFRVTMVADAGNGASPILDEPLESSTKVASSVVRAVIRSKKEVLVHDLALQFELLEDKYFAEHRVISVLCVPMLQKGQVRGIVYLENRLSKGAFTGDRVQMVQILASQAAISLESAKLYEELEQRVVERTRDLRSLLGSLNQGIFTVSQADFTIDAEYSQFLEQILEEPRLAGRSLSQTLFQGSTLSNDDVQKVQQSFAACLGESSLAFEFNAAHLPREMQRKGRQGFRILELDWHPITDEKDQVTKILVVVRDVTALRGLQAEAQQRSEEMARITEIADVAAPRVRQFMDEADFYLQKIQGLLGGLDDATIHSLAGACHTLKGLARAVKFSQLARSLHDAEAIILQKKRPEPQAVAQAMSQVETALRAYQTTLRKLQRLFAGHEEVKDTAGWDRLKSDLELMIAETAALLGKPRPDFQYVPPRDQELSEPGLRLLRGVLIHLIRNSLDHGMESTRQGTISLTAEASPDGCRLLYQDDGRGLNLDRIRSKAEDQGLIPRAASLNRMEIAQLIFQPTFSTAQALSELSGRGIGLDAVRQDLNAAGGQIQLRLHDETATDRVRFHFEISLPTDGPWLAKGPLRAAG